GPGAGDLDPGAAAGADVPGLADGQAAGDAGVNVPGVLDAGGAFIAPHAADDLGGGLDDAPGAGQLADGLGVGGAHQPDAAIGGGADPVPLVVVAAQSLPGLGADLDADAEGPASLVELPEGDAAGHGRVVVAGQQDRAGLGVAGCGGVGDELGDGHG